MKDGGPAFPTMLYEHGGESDGMTLRDYFATNAPSDEVQELQFRHLSTLAQEALTGIKYPVRPDYKPGNPEEIAWQIAELEFKCAVNAAIRYKLATAMIKERNRT
jgi:hypothetical protein